MHMKPRILGITTIVARKLMALFNLATSICSLNDENEGLWSLHGEKAGAEIMPSTPPSLFTMQWYYSKNSTQHGPVSNEELREILTYLEILKTNMAW